MRHEYLSQQFQALASQDRRNVESEAAWQVEKPNFVNRVQQYERALVGIHGVPGHGHVAQKCTR